MLKYSVLMYEEFVSTTIGLVLIVLAMRTMKDGLFSRSKLNISSWYLIAVYASVISMTFSRGYGILVDSDNLRFYGALVSGLLTMIFYTFWGSMQMKWTSQSQRLVIGLLTFSVLMFGMGGLISNLLVETIGAIVMASIIMLIIVFLLKYALQNIPYILAHQRVKIITLGVLLMVFFEIIGVIFMQFDLWNLASVFFILRAFSWVIVTLGIIMPNFLKQRLSR